MQQLINNDTPDEVVPCLLIPVQGGRIILPNVTVAEIIPNVEPVKKDNMPEWLLGKIEWRGIDIPLVSYEDLSGQKLSIGTQELRIAVINSPNGESGKLRFFAIVVQGIPSLVKLEEPAIQENQNTVLQRGQKMAVTLETGYAVIPDLDMIEHAILAEDWQ